MEPRKPEMETKDQPIEKAAEVAEPKKEGTPVIDPKIAEFEAKLKSLEEREKEREARLEEAQRKITEVSNEKAAVEARLEEASRRPQGPDPALTKEMEEALSVAQLDPAKGAEQLVRLMAKTKEADKKESISEALKQVNKQQEMQNEYQAFVKKVKDENPDIVGEDHENIIRDMALVKMNSKKLDYKAAITESVKEYKKVMGKIKEQAEAKAPAPKGSTGEAGGSSLRPKLEKADNEAPEDTEDLSAESYVRTRQGKLAKQTSMSR